MAIGGMSDHLDNILFMNQSAIGLKQDMSTALHLLENSGFVVNLTKSHFSPTQLLEFLGFQVNTIDMTLILPQHKVKSIQDLCLQLIEQKSVAQSRQCSQPHFTIGTYRA